MKVQVLGVCRFSLLVTEGFRTMPKSLDDRRRALYDAARLAARFHWFEHVLLPSIRAQSDPDFTFLVVTGEDLPEPWLGRLHSLVETVPQMELVQAPPAAHGEACGKALRERRDPRADVVAEFRLDDDDAVSLDYVRRVRSDFLAYVSPIYATWPLVAVDYCKGFLLTGINGEASLHAVTASSWACAMTLYMPPGHDRSVLDYHHFRLFRRMSVLSLQDKVMYVRGVHDWNDSGIRDRDMSEPLEMERAQDWMAQRFGIDLNRFCAGLRVLEEGTAK